jgi:predicted outer membrane repeat protein
MNQNGGALAIVGSSDVWIEETLFYGNSIGMMDRFVVNVLHPTLGGGAVAVFFGNVTFEKVQFFENMAIQGENPLELVGGAILASARSTVTINSSIFNSNAADGNSGGAIYIEAGSNLYTSGGTLFYINSASNGGAIALGSGTNYVEITNSSFFDNQAQNGGAIYSEAVFFVKISSCLFTGNHVNVGGSAIRAQDNFNLLVEDSDFVGSFSNETLVMISQSKHISGSEPTFRYCTFVQPDIPGSIIVLDETNVTVNMHGSAICSPEKSISVHCKGGQIYGDLVTTGSLLNCTNYKFAPQKINLKNQPTTKVRGVLCKNTTDYFTLQPSDDIISIDVSITLDSQLNFTVLVGKPNDKELPTPKNSLLVLNSYNSIVSFSFAWNSTDQGNERVLKRSAEYTIGVYFPQEKVLSSNSTEFTALIRFVNFFYSLLFNFF